MIHVMPSAVITSQCHRLQGKRSSRAGMLVRNAPGVMTSAATIVRLRNQLATTSASANAVPVRSSVLKLTAKVPIVGRSIAVICL